MAHSMCQHFQANNIVSPSHVHKGLFVAGTFKHNPTSTTAHSSFYGTTLVPTKDNIDISQETLMLE